MFIKNEKIIGIIVASCLIGLLIIQYDKLDWSYKDKIKWYCYGQFFPEEVYAPIFQNIDGDGHIQRMKVPDGWIVKYKDSDYKETILFLPDSKHKWKLW